MNKISRLILISFGLFLIGFAVAEASPMRRDAIIKDMGDAFTVSVSSSEWTAFPSTGSIMNTRNVVFVTNDSANADYLGGTIVDGLTAPTDATTIQPFQFPPGVTVEIDLGPDKSLWLITNDTAASDNCHGVEAQLR